MEKKDLHIPFKWKDRYPIVIDRLLYVPNYYKDHQLFANKKYFANTNSIEIEYCSGNGQWIIEKAKQNPHINYIAVEIKFDRAKKIWIKLHKENLDNLFVVMGEGLIFTKYYLSDESISNIYINFPDPWPKKRHAKNRIVSEKFIQQIHRVMKKNTVITLVTDDVFYLKQIIETFLKNKNFKPFYEKPYFIQDLEDFGYSFFDTLFRNKNKSINYLKFEKK